MADSDSDKSQEATAHRRQQAREEGQVPQSQDLASAAVLLGCLIVLAFAGQPLIEFMAQLVSRQLGGPAWLTGDASFVTERWHELMLGLANVLLPVLGLGLLLAIGTNLMQVGPLFLVDKLTPDFSRINPLSGFQRLLSMTNLVRLAFGIVKIAIVGAVAFGALYNRQDDILKLVGLDVAQIAWFAWDLCFWTCVKIGIALLVLSILDYGFQRWRHEQDLMMSTQEVREEMRNLQGDPQTIARRRNVQRQLAMNRLSSAVPKADVVITNPTELAIALQYDHETMAAPVVVAKGAGVIAQRIRRLALEHGVPIVEKKPLAQALYRDVDLNQPIPDQLYAGVAEVLAYVYQLKGKAMPKPR